MQLKQFLNESPHCARLIAEGCFNKNNFIHTYGQDFNIFFIEWAPDRVKHLLFSKSVWSWDKKKRLFVFENADRCSTSLQTYIKSEVSKCSKYCLLVFDSSEWSPWSAYCKANISRTIVCQPPTMSQKLSLIEQSLKYQQLSKTPEEKLTIATSIHNYDELDLYLKDLGKPVFENHINQVDRNFQITIFEAVKFMQTRARLHNWDQLLVFADQFGYKKIIRILQRNIQTKNVYVRSSLLDSFSLLDWVGVQNSSKIFPIIVCSNVFLQVSKTTTQTKIIMDQPKTQSLASLIRTVAKFCCGRKTQMELFDIFTNYHDPKAILDSLCPFVLDPLVIKNLTSKLQSYFENFQTDSSPPQKKAKT